MRSSDGGPADTSGKGSSLGRLGKGPRERGGTRSGRRRETPTMGVVVAVPDRRQLDLPPRSLVLWVRPLSQQIGHLLRYAVDGGARDASADLVSGDRLGDPGGVSGGPGYAVDVSRACYRSPATRARGRGVLYLVRACASCHVTRLAFRGRCCGRRRHQGSGGRSYRARGLVPGRCP